ncbi:nodulation protein NfeD [Haliea sp. E1-2-M8]|uniref:NfeD family protein n=1 Tax=Haliea sp. E1-2-M8 TaxID=3064706 RepID=UPI002719BA4D|nr:nodulation protein NfeD [Haliea sp. E1-2-M8]MDO8860849.1 nodulation protein NfeD [Haliea sp. E1-2-M8]
MTSTRCGLLLLLLVLAWPARSEVWVVDIEGAIGPASADHMRRSLDKAVDAGAIALVLRIDTPGGLDTAMRDMIKAILGSTVPVIAYVAPSGARAASAGTYLLYASHIAAMAPGTNLGAATPVQIGGTPALPGMPGSEERPDESPDGDGQSAPAKGSAMERKIVNDAVAYIRSLAQLRGRNADWAEQAVREGVSLAAADALEAGVIDLVANNMAELLAQLDGRQVTVGETAVTLRTADAPVFHQPLDRRSEFLSVITNPNIAYILLMVGIYGLVIEFYNPGIGLPGIVGAISLLIALYALQMLPISYAGMGLILLGIALMAAEALAPSFGVLGLGGVAAFVTGSVMLMDTTLPAFQLALPMIVAVTVFSAGLLVFALGMILRSRKRAVVAGVEHLLGATVPVIRVEGGDAWIWLDGESWHARSDTPLAPNDRVTVTAIDGLTAIVRKQAVAAAEE